MTRFAYVLKGLVKSAIHPSIMVHKLTLKKNILFTFDDGPHPEITPRVLDLLDEYGAKSVFFIPGTRIKRAPHLLTEILNRGHAIGNHGFHHTPCSQLSYRRIVEEIDECREAIFSNCGVVTRLFRPPHGIVNLSTILAARKTGHKIIRWSLDSGEYSYLLNATSGELAANFRSRVSDREIVLSHDDKETVPNFLRQVLPRLVDQGYDLSSGKLSLDPSTTERKAAISGILLPTENTATITAPPVAAGPDPDEILTYFGTTSPPDPEDAERISSVVAG